MIAELTPEQDREYAIGQIRDYALTHSLSADAIRMIFEAGMGAARRLRPDIFDPPEKRNP